jgi:hypothetical protein
MCGQTGAGKSSYNMQAIVSWALGKPCFGIEPARPLTSLLVQAENDSVDIAEFRDGVFKGLNFTDEEKASFRGRIHVVRENARTAAEFVTAVQNALNVCLTEDWVRLEQEGREKRYHLTPKGEKEASEKPTVTNWNPPPTTNPN